MLDDIDIFIKLVEYGSFSLVSDKLGIQQSTVSKRIQKLETELNTLLIDRKFRALKLTDSGKFVYQKFNKMSAYADIAISQIKTINKKEPEKKYELNLILGPALSSELIIFRLNEFTSRNPNVILNIKFAFAFETITEHEMQNTDLVFSAYNIDSKILGCRFVRSEYLNLFASKAYYEKHGIPKNIDELHQHKIIGGIDPRNGKNIDYTTITNMYTNQETTLSIHNPDIRVNNVLMCKKIGMYNDEHLFWSWDLLCRDEIAKNEIIPVLREWRFFKQDFYIHTKKIVTTQQQNLINFINGCLNQ